LLPHLLQQEKLITERTNTLAQQQTLTPNITSLLLDSMKQFHLESMRELQEHQNTQTNMMFAKFQKEQQETRHQIALANAGNNILYNTVLITVLIFIYF
jgi:hypothetical protein